MFKPPNYTQIPNEFIDEWLPKLTLVETKVLLVIMRKTFGWHKIRDRISLTQLEKLTGCEKKAIIKATKSLEKTGLISKEVIGKNGTQQTFYELNLIEDSNNSYQCPTARGTSGSEPQTKETLTKENISPIVPKNGDLPSSRKKDKEPKHEVAPGVWLTNQQRLNILSRLNGNTEKVVSCYDKLSVWKIGKGISGGNDYLSIIRWVIKAVEDEALKPKVVDRTEQDKEFAGKIKLKYREDDRIDLGYNYIEIKMGRMGIPDPHLVFGENGFKEQLENCLRKIGLNSD